MCLTISECHNLVHGVEDDWVLKHAVIVELAKILDFSNASLIESVVILLQPKCYGLDDVVNHLHNKGGMIAIEGAQKNSKEMDTPIFDLARF